MQIPDRPVRRYIRRGRCLRCGWCCLTEDPPCPHLEKLSDGTYSCKIYGKKERPLRCKLFPEMPPILHEGCGYYFLDTWNNNRRLKVGEV